MGKLPQLDFLKALTPAKPAKDAKDDPPAPCLDVEKTPPTPAKAAKPAKDAPGDLNLAGVLAELGADYARHFARQVAQDFQGRAPADLTALYRCYCAEALDLHLEPVSAEAFTEAVQLGVARLSATPPSGALAEGGRSAA